ncbi:MAG: VC_2705 family sodium/solute symporter [Alphaproteobacteria bacterium]|nr:VC_2705 family sodium/solute symporter [Alphaproteobacteria bacterium]
MAAQPQTNKGFTSQLTKVYGFYTGGFISFVLILAVAEQMGLPRNWIGYLFLAMTVLLYAGIGIMSRTNDADEYYVAGRRVPALFNGMATGADWMSAASFIGMAGTLYLTGYSGLAFIMGWTGGYCLVALFLAPYLRKFGQFTIPDFLGARYGGHAPRFVGIVIAILCSFTYVVAQIYGVGLITTRLSGVDFTLGIFVGLGGILVCSFLGGMRAVTWTQVAQYIILIIAYMTPLVWLSAKQTGIPIPQAVYGMQLQKVTELEIKLNADAKEIEVRGIFAKRAAEAKALLADIPKSLADGKANLDKDLAAAKEAKDDAAVAKVEAAIAKFPKDETEAKAAWNKQAGLAARAAPIAAHGEAFAAKDEAARTIAKKNFLALILCLMVGTAALPHILMRYYTTPSVKDARASVTWSLFFIFLLYFSAPALAVLVKFVVYNDIVGTTFAALPEWVRSWQAVDPSLLSLSDINGDGIVQRAEIAIGGDIVVLATPEIAGLPYVVSGLVAAGGLAAALSTADGLLLTIANALSHDLYYKMIDPNAPVARRVMLSKTLLLVVAVLAALVAAQKPADILFLVSAAFSLAAAGFFPALVCGIFWKRATGIAATLGMAAGVGITFFYMMTTQPWLREMFFGTPRSVPAELWWDINPISAGLFGIPLGFIIIFVVSLITPAPSKEIQHLIEDVRYPNLKRA